MLLSDNYKCHPSMLTLHAWLYPQPMADFSAIYIIYVEKVIFIFMLNLLGH